LVLSSRSPAALEDLARSVGGLAVPADLSLRQEAKRLIEAAGDVEVLVANAGLPGTGDLEDFSEEELDKILEVNLAGPMHMTRLLLPQFRQRGSGHFVYIASLAGRVASPRGSIYSATKFGLRGFAAGLRADLYGSGIGVSVISPGFVREAGMFAEAGVDLPPGVGTVSPEQVAEAVVEALRHNRAELAVAPAALRAGALLASVAPGLSAAAQSRFGGALAERLAEAQRSKR